MCLGSVMCGVELAACITACHMSGSSAAHLPFPCPRAGAWRGQLAGLGVGQ